MKKSKIPLTDKLGFAWLTFKKNFYFTFNHKLNLSYSKKIKKLMLKRDKMDKKIFDKYQQVKLKYDRFIAYLQFKDLHK